MPQTLQKNTLSLCLNEGIGQKPQWNGSALYFSAYLGGLYGCLYLKKKLRALFLQQNPTLLCPCIIMVIIIYNNDNNSYHKPGHPRRDFAPFF